MRRVPFVAAAHAADGAALRRPQMVEHRPRPGNIGGWLGGVPGDVHHGDVVGANSPVA